MNKYLKYGLWTIAAALALVAGAIAFIALTFDPNTYKPQIIQAVKDDKQRTLKLDGDIQLHIFPVLGVNLSKVSLSEFQSEQEFVSVESAAVSLKLLPLLFRQLVVDEVAVSGVRAQFVKYKNGKTNLDDLMGREDLPAVPAASAPAAASPMHFDIATVRLEKSELNFRDETSGARYSVSDLNLATGRIASGVPTKIDLAARVQSGKPKLDITVKIKTTLTFDLEKGLYQVQGLDLQAGGAALDMTGLSVKAGGDASAQPASEQFSMQNFALSASGTKREANTKQGDPGYRFEAKLDAPDLNLTKDQFSGSNFALNAKLDGEFGNVFAALSMPRIEGSARSFKVEALQLDAALKQAEQAFTLKLTSPLTGSIETRQFNLSALKLALNATGDKLPGKNINSEMKGGIRTDFGRQNIEADLAGGLLQSRIKAKFAVKNFNVPMIRYDLEIDQFDADPYMPKQTAEAGGKGKEAGPEQPIDLSALKTLNLEGSLRIGSLKAANIKVAQLRVDVKAKNGIVNIAPLSAKMYQGGIDGKVSANAATNGFAANAKMTGIDIAPLMKDATGLELLEGKGNVVLDIAAQGNTVGALKKALNGKATVNMANGAIKGIDLTKLVQGMQKLSKETTTQTLGVDKNEKTAFSEFKAGFKIKNGVAHNDDLAVKSAVLRITGKGDIDIGRGQLDYNAKAIFARTEQGRTATLPVHVSGAFDNPKFKMDYTALLKDAAKQRIDEKKEKLKNDAKAKAREELKKGLKGLLK